MPEVITFLLSAIGTSAVVSGIVVYLAKTAIAERLRQAIGHEYAQKLEAHRAVLKSEYNVQLERLRADNASQLAVQAAAQSSAGEAHRAAHESRLAAIEVIWQAALQIREAASPVLMYLDILTDPELVEAPHTSEFRAAAQDLSEQSIQRRLFEPTTDVERARPFVGDEIFSLFYVYRAVAGRVEFLALRAIQAGRFEPWWRDMGLRHVLRVALTDQEMEQLEQWFQRYGWLRTLLETKLLASFQSIISGEASARFSIQQALRIVDAVDHLAREDRRAD